MEWKIAQKGTVIGIHNRRIPTGTIFTHMHAERLNGRILPEAYVWIEDTDFAYAHTHMVCFYMQKNWDRPKKMYVDKNKGWEKSLWEFMCLHKAEIKQPKWEILTSDVRKICPKDREIGAYIYMPIPCGDDNPKTNSTKIAEPVTNPCKISNRLLRQESYNVMRMGMRTPDFRFSY